MSESDYQVLHHTLGISDHRTPEPYRNHFVAGEGHHDMDAITRLCESGLMTEGKSPSFIGDGQRVFYVTEKGRIVAIDTRPKPPKRTRGQKRYQKYLDCDCCESFGDWLKDPYWDDYRAT